MGVPSYLKVYSVCIFAMSLFWVGITLVQYILGDWWFPIRSIPLLFDFVFAIAVWIHYRGLVSELSTTTVPTAVSQSPPDIPGLGGGAPIVIRRSPPPPQPPAQNTPALRAGPSDADNAALQAAIMRSLGKA